MTNVEDMTNTELEELKTRIENEQLRRKDILNDMFAADDKIKGIINRLHKNESMYLEVITGTEYHAIRFDKNSKISFCIGGE